MSRLYMALAAFVVLGVLSWATLSNPKLRFATLAVLAMFALKSWLRRNDVMHPDGESETEQQ
jgi:membrane protein implicated in regulation of membrane protease activity